MVVSLSIRRMYYKSVWRMVVYKVTTFLKIRAWLEERFDIEIVGMKVVKPNIKFGPVSGSAMTRDLTAQFDGMWFYFDAKAGTVTSERLDESSIGEALGYDLKINRTNSSIHLPEDQQSEPHDV